MSNVGSSLLIISKSGALQRIRQAKHLLYLTRSIELHAQPFDQHSLTSTIGDLSKYQHDSLTDIEPLAHSQQRRALATK
ncbi:hypothetical protein D3C75_1288100 [compost metagenome]